MQILNSFLKDSAPKTKESLKNVSKFSWCDLGRDCIKRKVKVNVQKITEMEIAKWKKGISTFDAHYNFVYSTFKRLDVQKVSRSLEKQTKKTPQHLKSDNGLSKKKVLKTVKANANMQNYLS